MRPARLAALIAVFALAGLGAWVALRGGQEPPSRGTTPGDVPGGPFLFADITEQTGIRFRHEDGAQGKWFIAEPMGGGAGFFDYDGDGDLDIYLVQSGVLHGPPGPDPPRNALYRNDGDGTYTDVTDATGTGDSGYGLGCALADYDNDGDVDIYITNLGPNVLLRNRGDGTFQDVSQEAGVADPRYGEGCLFADVDRDGYLDLYVANYVVLSLEEERFCGTREVRTYCHPADYEPEADVFYHNLGDGTFADWTEKAGLDKGGGKGLGVVGADFDNDGDTDIYVANDVTPNFLFRNKGDGSFEEVAQLLGVAFGERGTPEAGMGIAVGDYDGDGWMDIFVTNFAQETNSLYRNAEGEFFENRINLAGLAGPSMVPLSFGTGFFDLDLDGHLDLLLVSGHIEINIAHFFDYQSYPQRNQVFRNMGDGTLEDVSSSAGPPFAEMRVSRGLAQVDIDLDGDLDFLITNLDDFVQILENRSPRKGNWVSFQPRTGDPSRVATGARFTVETGDGIRIRELFAAGSYCTQGEPWVHFGLGEVEEMDAVEIRWPSGATERFEKVKAGRRYRVLEASGKLEELPVPPK